LPFSRRRTIVVECRVSHVVLAEPFDVREDLRARGVWRAAQRLNPVVEAVVADDGELVGHRAGEP